MFRATLAACQAFGYRHALRIRESRDQPKSVVELVNVFVREKADVDEDLGFGRRTAQRPGPSKLTRIALSVVDPSRRNVRGQ